MAMEKTKLTLEGLRKYESELRELKVERRRDVAEKIKVARAQGDLSENADYDAAKDEQSEIENRIAELENILKFAEVVDEAELSQGKVNVGSLVKIYDFEFEEELEYQIVGSTEANSLKNKISYESPVGAALVGHIAGETVTVNLPSGDSAQYKILDVKKA